jgi:2-methylisocitrate lyase-like PEP mutase family enzyme
MDIARQQHLADQFQAQHRGKAFVLPNAWDPMSALLIQDAGFPSLATTGGGVSWALGWPDGERAPWLEIVGAVGRITRRLRIPVSADIEGGFAKSEAELKHNVMQIIEAGAVGVNIEDQEAGKLRDLDQACARIRAAREASHKSGVPLVITARTDVFHLAPVSEQTIDLALIRAEAYLNAGASCIFLFGLSDLEHIARLTKLIGAPINVVGRPGGPSLSQYSAAGVKRVSLAAGLALRAYGVVSDVAIDLHATGAFDKLTTNFTRARAQKLTSSGTD